MVSVADLAPALAGWKLTATVVEAPGATVTLPASSKESVNCAAAVPVMLVASTVIAGSPGCPRLNSWTVLDWVPPRCTAPKLRLEGEAASWLGAAAGRISMPLTAGFSTTWPKAMSRLASLETTNDLTTPLSPPTSAKTS